MAETGIARAGRWYWLLLAPRSFYRAVIADRSYADLDQPLCLPTDAAIRAAGARTPLFRLGGAAE